MTLAVRYAEFRNFELLPDKLFDRIGDFGSSDDVECGGIPSYGTVL